ncbi:MAG: hypothetical protein ICV87_02855 [Gemmatimonadetes bacterium]|jgi:hypothetical protein|nr:hypothetical protein [Gemmatimonadota bacterium]
MADLNVRRESEPVVEDDYTMLEVLLWVLGILMIPLVPILMVAFLTPFSGM